MKFLVLPVQKKYSEHTDLTEIITYPHLRMVKMSVIVYTIQKFSLNTVVGQMIKTECLSLGSRRGLLAYVYNGVSLTMNEY